MKFIIACPYCQGQMQITEDDRCKTIICPHCSKKMKVPQLPDAVEPPSPPFRISRKWKMMGFSIACFITMLIALINICHWHNPQTFQIIVCIVLLLGGLYGGFHFLIKAFPNSQKVLKIIAAIAFFSLFPLVVFGGILCFLFTGDSSLIFPSILFCVFLILINVAICLKLKISPLWAFSVFKKDQKG